MHTLRQAGRQTGRQAAAGLRSRIAVLVGGDGPERERSVGSGEAILGALRDAGRDATLIHVDRDLDLWLRQERAEVAFLAMRGRAAVGTVQGLLETLGIPYTGSSFAATSLAADRLKTREQLRLHNLPAPAYYRHARGLGSPVDQHGDFGFPCLIAPRTGGLAAAPFAWATDEDELCAAVEVALRLDDELIVERRPEGIDVQVAIVDGEILGAAEVQIPGPVGLEAALRHRPGRGPAAQVVIPPRLGLARLRGVLTQAVRAHHLLGCDGATCVQLVVSERGNEQIVDVDTAVDLGPGSLLPRIAHAAGQDFPALVLRILDGARLHAGRRMRERREAQLPLLTADRRAGGSADTH